MANQDLSLKDIVLKLTGPIQPVGETNTDNDRFENLKILCSLVNDLVSLIDDVNYQNRCAYQYSIKRASEFAENFMTKTLGIKD